MSSNENKPLLREKVHTRTIALGVAVLGLCLGGYITLQDIQASSDATMRGAGMLAHIQTNATGLVIVTASIFLAAVVVACDRLGRRMNFRVTFGNNAVELGYGGMQHQRDNLDKLLPVIAAAIDRASGSATSTPTLTTPVGESQTPLPPDIKIHSRENRTVH